MTSLIGDVNDGSVIRMSAEKMVWMKYPAEIKLANRSDIIRFPIAILSSEYAEYANTL